MNNKTLYINHAFALILFSVLTVTLLITSSALHAANRTGRTTTEYELEVKSLALLYVKSQNEFLFFLNDKFYNFLAQNSSKPDQTFSSLTEVPDNYPMIVYIENEEVLESLSSMDKETLMTYFDNSYFIGVGSQGDKLKSLLDVNQGTDLEAADEAFNIDLFFIHKDTDNVINELLLNGINSVEDTMRHLISWYDKLKDTEQISPKASSTSGAWDASYTRDYRTQLEKGTARFLVNGFKLKSPADKPDYFLLTTSIQTDITSNICNSLKGHCGWFSNEMYLAAKVDTSNGGQLYEYMPTGSVGSSTTGFTIGASLTTTQAGISGSYSSSYSISDATYIDNSDYITNTAKWTIKFTKPSYIWFPFLVDAPNVARNSYETHPALIIEVPKGECAKVSLFPYILQENDTFKYEVLVLKVTEHHSDWYSKSTALPQTVICGS